MGRSRHGRLCPLALYFVPRSRNFVGRLSEGRRKKTKKDKAPPLPRDVSISALNVILSIISGNGKEVASCIGSAADVPALWAVLAD